MISRRLTSRLIVAVALAAASAALVGAATPLNVKLGLWEATSVNQMTGMPAMPNMDLSTLPPEQRARIEAAMKQRQEATGGKPHVTKTCVTQEKLEKDFYQDRQMDPSCKRTVTASTASLQEISIACSGEHKMTGTARFEAIDPEHVKGTMHFVSEAGAQPVTVNSTFTARYLGADCGDVK